VTSLASESPAEVRWTPRDLAPEGHPDEGTSDVFDGGRPWLKWVRAVRAPMGGVKRAGLCQPWHG
jgi:hypothetical protein